MKPSTGVSQVSIATKMLKASWICIGSPAMGLLYRADEERPAVLQIGDERHAQDADGELPYPSCARLRERHL